MIAKSYSSKLFNLPILITRFANIYGPGQLNFTALIPDVVKSCLMKKKFQMRSDCEAIRDFIYVKDIIELYKLLAKNLYLYPKKYSGEVFNAGTNVKYKIKDVVKKIFIFTKKQDQLRNVFRKIKKNKTKGEISHN